MGIYGALNPNAKHGIHADETTLGELVKQQGYATAMIGKWHLGHLPEFLPPHHGFDESFVDAAVAAFVAGEREATPRSP